MFYLPAPEGLPKRPCLVSSFFPKLLKDSSFLAPLLTRLTNFMIFQKGWESSWKSAPGYRRATMLTLFSPDVQDWRSFRAVHAADQRRLLGHVVQHTLQWWKPGYGQVCVCVCVWIHASTFWCSPPLFSILQYINQRLKHRERWVGALTSTFVPCEFTAASSELWEALFWAKTTLPEGVLTQMLWIVCLPC